MRDNSMPDKIKHTHIHPCTQHQLVSLCENQGEAGGSGKGDGLHAKRRESEVSVSPLLQSKNCSMQCACNCCTAIDAVAWMVLCWHQWWATHTFHKMHARKENSCTRPMQQSS